MDKFNFLLLIISFGIAFQAKAMPPRILFSNLPDLFQSQLGYRSELDRMVITKKDIEKIIPLNEINRNTTSDEIVKKMADKGFQLAMNQSNFKNTSLGRLSNRLQDLFRFELVINKNGNQKSDEIKYKFSDETVLSRTGQGLKLSHEQEIERDKKLRMSRLESIIYNKPSNFPFLDRLKQHNIEHKVHFNIGAFESKTELQYSGWTTALFKYDFRSFKSEVQVSEKIYKNKQLYLSQIQSPDQVNQVMGVKWGF